jgi:hypothetical protein
MYEVTAAVITGAATLIAALLATQDGRELLKSFFNPTPGSAEGANALSRGPTASRLRRFVWVFVVGAAAGGIFFHLAASAAERMSFTGGYKMPVGTIVAYRGIIAPDGWLICDGTKIDAEHKDLRRMVGESTPNLQGRFLRGLDPSGTIDPEGKTRALGSQQEDKLKRHQHQYTLATRQDAGKSGPDAPDVMAIHKTAVTDLNSDGADETRPKNVAVNFIIKY